ncbi:MAG: alanine--tRNA ligase-related protein [Candidatus Paceibacterota bacterium]
MESRRSTGKNASRRDWWGDSEVFYEFTDIEHDPKWGEHCHPNCDCGRFMEIGNSVFMEYIKTETSFEKLPKQNVDFGGGLERIAAAANNSPDMFEVDLLKDVVLALEAASGKSYQDNLEAFRVVTDHIRGAVFMVGDGVLPSNTEQGYFVRRLLRRSVRYADALELPTGSLGTLASSVIKTYQTHYTNLSDKQADIVHTINQEEEQFRKTLARGLREFEKRDVTIAAEPLKLKLNPATKKLLKEQFPLKVKAKKSFEGIGARRAFELFTTYGFPIELTIEEAAKHGKKVDIEGFERLMKEHKEKSRAGAEQKFKGGLADHSEKVVQYHSATHLMLAALRHFLGEHVHQAGSNITGERLRFDFTHPEKVERETLDKIEAWVNNAIKMGGVVTTETMPKNQAENDPTVEGSFWDRYPDEVKVYTMTGTDGTIFSRELCGGPHVEKLEDIIGTFKIKKEESSSAGVRRIKAVLID